MDTRSAVQFFSFLMVAFMLFYHFEVDSQVVVTWNEVIAPSSGPPMVHVPVPDVLPPPAQQQVLPVQVSAPAVPLEPVQVLGPAPVPVPVHVPIEVKEQAPAPVPAPTSVSLGSIELTVTLPKTISLCNPSDVIFTADKKLDTQAQLSLLEKLFVDITCDNLFVPDEKSQAEPLGPVIKTLPASPLTDRTFVARIIPDESIGECEIHVRSDASVTLSGTLEKKYEVQDLIPSRASCWECEPLAHFYRDVPLAYQFLLKNDKGDFLFTQPDVTIQQGETLTLWIVPHPVIAQKYPDLVDKLLFNSWMNTDHVKQANHVSYQFNKEKGGYKLEIDGRDLGDFKLMVTLNWIYPFSELNTDDPEPILCSSHIRHGVSRCDKERSETFESSVLHVLVQGDNEFLLSSGEQCDCSMKPGRWLNVIPVATECRVPFCTGDRVGSFVSSPTWNGARKPQLWVPYDCQYHLYNRDDFEYCAKENNIKWIAVIGDSLSREIVGHIMSLYDLGDTTKFDHADLMLGDSGIRVTFLSFADELLKNKGSERTSDYAGALMNHFNMLEAGSSQGLHYEKFRIDLEAEETSPDAFIFNGANAYCLFQESESSFERWLHQLSDIVGDAFKNGRKGDGKKSKVYWYGNPYFHGTAHAGTEFITQGRNTRFNEITKPIVEGMGVKYFDSHHIGQARWEESWDGLHYLRGSLNELWTGQVASTFVQALFNEIFEGCSPDTSN